MRPPPIFLSAWVSIRVRADGRLCAAWHVRVLSVSSTTTLAILTAAELGAVVPDGDPTKLITATATLTLLSGACLIAASLLQLGFVANFISSPVLTGFKCGIELVIVFDQLQKLLGIHFEKAGFFRDIYSLLQHLPETLVLTFAVAAASLLLLGVVERLWPHSPAPLAVLAGGMALSWGLGIDQLGVKTVGLVPRSLPQLTLPYVDLALALLPGALGIALMSFTETAAAGRAFAKPTDGPIDPNRELLATGAADALGGLFGAMPAGGGTSQTAVVRSVGGRTQKASIVTAAAALATMLVLGLVIGLLPRDRACRGRDRLRCGGVRGNPAHSYDGIHLGGRRAIRRSRFRNAARHRGRDRTLAGRAFGRGVQPESVCHRAQARRRRSAAAQLRPPGRRNL
jgi:sulfate permease, SulP family